jgi:hypothetical protein
MAKETCILRAGVGGGWAVLEVKDKRKLPTPQKVEFPEVRVKGRNCLPVWFLLKHLFRKLGLFCPPPSVPRDLAIALGGCKSGLGLPPPHGGQRSRAGSAQLGGPAPLWPLQSLNLILVQASAAGSPDGERTLGTRATWPQSVFFLSPGGRALLAFVLKLRAGNVGS